MWLSNKLGKVEFLRTMLAIGISLLVAFTVILIISEEPINALQSFIFGPISTFRRFGNVIELMIPLMFSGLATIFLFRVGLFNLSAEGSIFIGAVVATIISLTLDLPPILLLLISVIGAGIAGAVVAFIPGILKVKCNANEIVTSLMLNYVALDIGLYFMQEHFRDPNINTMYSYKFPVGVAFSKIINGTRIHSGLIVAILFIIIAYYVLYRTSFGYKSKLVGSNHKMADYSGINSSKMIILTQVIGGFIAGLGGSVELFGMYERFQYTDLTGYGWDGILIAIVAKHNPKLIPISALFLSYIRAGADIMSRQSDVPFEIIQIIQAIVIVFISAKVLLSRYRKNVLKREADRLEREKGVTNIG